MTKKKILLGLSIAALMTVGTGTIVNSNLGKPQEVIAASRIKKLRHRAAVYKSSGRRRGKKVLARGKKLRILGTKIIKGKKYYRIGKNRYVKAANFALAKMKTVKKGTRKLRKTATRNTIKFPTLHTSRGTGVKTTTKLSSKKNKQGKKKNKSGETTIATGARQNVNKSSMLDGSAVTAKEEARARKYKNKYIYFTDAQVTQMEDSLWQDIQQYRKTKGYPDFKKNAELTKLAQNAQIGGQAAFRRFNNKVSQNTNEIKAYLPTLASQGMDQAKGYVSQNIYSLGHNGIYIGGDMTKTSPTAAADKAFKMLKESTGFESKLIYGWKEHNAYGALSLRYYIGNTDYVDNSIGISFFTADGTSAQWVSAWQAAN